MSQDVTITSDMFKKADSQFRSFHHQPSHNEHKLATITPSNIDIAAKTNGFMHHSALKPSMMHTVQNFTQSNMSAKKSGTILNAAKPVIEQIHTNLKSRRRIPSELLKLDKLHHHLPLRLQKMFVTMPGHREVLDEVHTLNK